jgi:hypothetical protein
MKAVVRGWSGGGGWGFGGGGIFFGGKVLEGLNDRCLYVLLL